MSKVPTTPWHKAQTQTPPRSIVLYQTKPKTVYFPPKTSADTWILSRFTAKVRLARVQGLRGACFGGNVVIGLPGVFQRSEAPHQHFIQLVHQKDLQTVQAARGWAQYCKLWQLASTKLRVAAGCSMLSTRRSLMFFHIPCCLESGTTNYVQAFFLARP